MSLCVGGLGCEGKSKAAKADAPVLVVTAKAERLDLPREVRTFGSVEASSSVDVNAQVQGQVTEVHFREGDFVKKGDPLFTIDTRPYRASLAAAQAELSRSKAVADQAQLEAERALRLKSEGVASDQEVSKAAADAASSAANVRVGQAQIQSASLNVAFTRITAPLDGRTGSLLVHPGNLVRPSDPEPMVVIRSLSPVYVRFAIPQEHLTTVREHLGKDPLVARVTPRGSKQQLEGVVTFMENTVDAATGNVTLKATFLNREQELWPGASVDVVLVLGVDKAATVVPEAALQRSQNGMLVFVVRPGDTVEPRKVVVGRTTETQALITSGLEPGEEVVTDGQMRLRKGARIGRSPAMAAPSGKPQREAP